MSVNQDVIKLTPDQSVAILEKVKEILGPNGENWIQEHWIAVPYEGDDEDDVWDDDSTGYVDADWDAVTRKDAKYCIMGAIEQAAFALGISSHREQSQRFAAPISLLNLVKSQFGERYDVVDVNDDSDTSWETMRDLIDTRLGELRTS